MNDQQLSPSNPANMEVGRPCIRGLRITFYDVLEYLASGITAAGIVEDFPLRQMEV